MISDATMNNQNMINQQSVQPVETPTAFPTNAILRSININFYGAETGLDVFDLNHTNYLELHVYDMENKYLMSDSNVSDWELKAPTSNDNPAFILEADIHSNIRAMGLVSGNYRFKYQLSKKLVGDIYAPIIQLDKISKSRLEVRVALNTAFPLLQENSTLLFNAIKSISRFTDSGYKRNLALNFGKNIIAEAISWKEDNWTYENAAEQNCIVFRLSTPLDASISQGDTLNISYKLGNSISDVIQLIPANQIKRVNVLSTPNFSAKINTVQRHQDTGYENIDTIINSTDEVDSKILNKYFSGSAVELNIDYTNFENFVFYSSAESRISNFKNKIKAIEVCDNSIATLLSATSASVTSSEVLQNNVATYNHNKNVVIGSFDDFEKYMYYQSSSYVSNSYGIQEPRAWPKRNDAPPYILYSYTSSEAEDWYDWIQTSASWYDKNNYNSLRFAVPEHIRVDEYNSKYMTFVDMVAQQFDLLWLYVRNSVQILDRDENVFDGLSKDLVYYALTSMGWDVEDGHQFDELWDYLLGINNDGSTPVPGAGVELQPSQSLIFVESQSLATKDVNKEIWKRILNNLPFLLKTKGTEKSVQALLNIYGIPSTVLRIREYGGPKLITLPSKYKYDKFNYALNLNGENAVLIPRYQLNQTNRTPDAIEFRFKTINGDEFDFPTTNNSWSYQSLFRTDNGDISFNIERTTGIYGNLVMTWATYTGSVHYEGKATIVSGSSLFDGNWWSILINKDEPNDIISPSGTLSVYLKQSSYAEITNAFSGTIDFSTLHPTANVQYGIKNAVINSPIWRLGGGAAGPTGSMSGSDQSYLNLYPFTGSMQEFRYWATLLDESAFDNHVTAPTAHNFNYATGSYDNLAMRLSLGSDLKFHSSSDGDYVEDYIDDYVDESDTYYFNSVHPNQNITTFLAGEPISGSYHIYSDTSSIISYNSFTEEYAADWPDLSGNRSISNKIRIEDSTLIGELNNIRSMELSSFDSYPLDSHKLGIYFSPTNEVDENIAEFMGGVNIDDYIGEYSNIYANEYPSLNTLRSYYFKQFTDQYGVIDYIRLVAYFDQTLWKQIRKLVPARAAIDTGLVIEPHLLNRSKINLLSVPPTAINLQIDTYLNAGMQETTSADYSFITADMPGDVCSLTSSIDVFNYSASIIAVLDVESDHIDAADYTAEIIPYNLEGNSLNTTITPLLQYLGSWFIGEDDDVYAQSFQPNISSSRLSERMTFFYASMSIMPDDQIIWHKTYYPADIQDILPIGVINHRWNGCKIISADFNVPSPDTLDGRPVVEFFSANPNIITVNPSTIYVAQTATPTNLQIE